MLREDRSHIVADGRERIREGSGREAADRMHAALPAVRVHCWSAQVRWGASSFATASLVSFGGVSRGLLRRKPYIHPNGWRCRIRSRFFRECRVRPCETSNQAMQLSARKPVVYAWRVCRRQRMLRGIHTALAAADVLAR